MSRIALAHDLAVRDLGARGDLAGHDHHAGLRQALAGHPAVRVLREQRIEDGIGNLVAHLVRVSLGHGFRGEQEIFQGHGFSFAVAAQTPRRQCVSSRVGEPRLLAHNTDAYYHGQAMLFLVKLRPP